MAGMKWSWYDRAHGKKNQHMFTSPEDVVIFLSPVFFLAAHSPKLVASTFLSPNFDF